MSYHSNVVVDYLGNVTWVGREFVETNIANILPLFPTGSAGYVQEFLSHWLEFSFCFMFNKFFENIFRIQTWNISRLTSKPARWCSARGLTIRTR